MKKLIALLFVCFSINSVAQIENKFGFTLDQIKIEFPSPKYTVRIDKHESFYQKEIPAVSYFVWNEELRCEIEYEFEYFKEYICKSVVVHPQYLYREAVNILKKRYTDEYVLKEGSVSQWTAYLPGIICDINYIQLDRAIPGYFKWSKR